MNAEVYVYVWKNNAKRATMAGRACRVIARGRMNSIRIQFFDTGQTEITSRFAIRRLDHCGDCDPCLGGRPDQCAICGHDARGRIRKRQLDPLASRLEMDPWIDPAERKAGNAPGGPAAGSGVPTHTPQAANVPGEALGPAAGVLKTVAIRPDPQETDPEDWRAWADAAKTPQNAPGGPIAAGIQTHGPGGAAFLGVKRAPVAGVLDGKVLAEVDRGWKRETRVPVLVELITPEIGRIPCLECEGTGYWGYGPTPAECGPCVECKGTGKIFVS